MIAKNLSKIKDIKKVVFKSNNSAAGSLVAVDIHEYVPFSVRRFFYIYNVPSQRLRGKHAHRRCHQFIVCISGKCEIRVSDSVKHKSILLKAPCEALYVPPMIWAEQTYRTSGTILLVLASLPYAERDYIRNFEEFVAVRKKI